MTTFIKTKFKISDDQTIIDKYRLAAKITVYHIISKLILQRIIITNICGSENPLRKVHLESSSNFPVQEFFIQISPYTRKLDFCGPESHLGKVQYRTWNPHLISKLKKKNYSNRSINKEIGLLWSRESFK